MSLSQDTALSERMQTQQLAQDEPQVREPRPSVRVSELLA